MKMYNIIRKVKSVFERGAKRRGDPEAWYRRNTGEACGITINYKTLRLIKGCVKAFRKYYPSTHLIIIDNSNFDRSSDWIFAFAKKDKNTTVLANAYNAHHGPSMHMGLAVSANLFKYALVFDSDVHFIKSGLIEDILKQIDGRPFLCSGALTQVNENGFDVAEGQGIPYIHPCCMLVDVIQYLKFRPFKKHGAPALDTMKDVQDKGTGGLLIPFTVRDYYKHHYGGTSKATGGMHLTHD